MWILSTEGNTWLIHWKLCKRINDRKNCHHTLEKGIRTHFVISEKLLKISKTDLEHMKMNTEFFTLERAIFKRVLKVIRHCIGFASSCYVQSRLTNDFLRLRESTSFFFEFWWASPNIFLLLIGFCDCFDLCFPIILRKALYVKNNFPCCHSLLVSCEKFVFLTNFFPCWFY